MGSNTQPPAHEVGVKANVPSYSVNNFTIAPETLIHEPFSFDDNQPSASFRPIMPLK